MFVLVCVWNATRGCGRWSSDQQGADPERVELAVKRFEEVYFVAEPGDALFFHALTLHSSRGNFSSERRLAFASCFTRENNVQWKDPCAPPTAFAPGHFTFILASVGDDRCLHTGGVPQVYTMLSMSGSR